MVNSRSKGQVGEREVCSLLRSELRLAVHRNWEAQSAEAGHSDIIVDWPSEYPGWSIEVKRYKSGSPAIIYKWWQQAAIQGASEGRRPVLIYRFDREKEWTARISIYDFMPKLSDHNQMSLPLQSFLNFVNMEMKTCFPWSL